MSAVRFFLMVALETPASQSPSGIPGVLPMMGYTGGSARKEYLFQSSGLCKGRDFTSWSI